MNEVHHSDALTFLGGLGESTVDLIYTDPPFGTGTRQTSMPKKGTRILSRRSYSDPFDDYLEFLRPILGECKRVLKDSGILYVNLDRRWVHYAKVELDTLFGRENFVSEIIWSYNFGGRSNKNWPAKHDNILMYAKDVKQMKFDVTLSDRMPYKAPALQFVNRTKEDAQRRIALGQVPTDVWEIPIIGTASKERVGYPSQKPLKLVERIIMTSSSVDDVVVDPFVGSGTTAHAAARLNRKFIVCDKSDEAINVVCERIKNAGFEFVIR